jgi:MoxR-like ATPase
VTHSVTPPTDPHTAIQRIRAEVAKAVIGQDAAVTGVLIGLLCRGHVLIEGVPGVAKTLLVRSLAAAVELKMTRIQFTADLMPGDVTGSLIYDASTGRFSFREGPVFTNLLLADEINRTPPKTQSALLESMEERQVTVDGQPRLLPEPFCVIATQNPIEYEGTYPLPEAQLDRFLLKVTMPLPDRDTELKVLAAHAGPRCLHRARGARLHRRTGASHPVRALDRAGGVAPRRHCPGSHRAGVGLAVGSGVRHPG